MPDLRPAYGTPVPFVNTGADTLADAERNGDYADDEKPDCAPPTPRIMQGTRGEGSMRER